MPLTVNKKYLMSNYSNLTGIRKISKLTNINRNSTNYLVVSREGKYVFHKFGKNESAGKMESVCKVLKFCKVNHANVLKPIERKNGNFVDKKNKAYLTEYYSGNLYTGSINELKDLSMNLANLHKTLSRCPEKFKYEKSHRAYEILDNSEWERISKTISNKSKITSIDKKILKNISFISECIRKNAIDSEIIKKYHSKEQIIHYDLHPKNIIFRKKRVSAIIDFNSMRKGKIEEDLAFCCYRFSLYKKNSLNEIKNRIKIFLDIYREFHGPDSHIIEKTSYYFRNITLQRLCYIIRMHYFMNSDLWISDFDKHLNLLKLQRKVEMI